MYIFLITDHLILTYIILIINKIQEYKILLEKTMNLSCLKIKIKTFSSVYGTVPGFALSINIKNLGVFHLLHKLIFFMES